MKLYEKPVITIMNDTAEGVYTASGDEDHPDVCRFGRNQANSGADTCQSCSYSNGMDANIKHLYESNYTGCPDKMPEK